MKEREIDAPVLLEKYKKVVTCQVQALAKIRKFNLALDVEEQEDDKAWEDYHAKKKVWAKESINNFLVAREVDLEYCEGEICTPSQYSEYPEEVDLGWLEDVVKNYG